MLTANVLCPCGGNAKFSDCCGRFIDAGMRAETADALMRSRYCAYVMLREDYLLQTWHASTRPSALQLSDGAPTRWLGLEVKRSERLDDDHALVEFVAKYKVNGRAHRLHEISRFVREAGSWFYLDGDLS